LSETDTRIDEYTIDQGTLYLHGTYHLNPAIQYFIQNAKITKATVVWEGPDARFVFAMLSEHAPLQSLTVILNNRTICAAMLDEPWYDFVLPFNEVEHEVDQDGSAFLYYTRAWKELCRITDVDELKITFDQPNGVNWDKGYTCPEMAEAPALENWLRNQFPEGWRPSINERMVVRDQAEQALAARLAASPASATTRKSVAGSDSVVSGGSVTITSLAVANTNPAPNGRGRCVKCAKHKKGCDGNRPCQRCVGPWAATCV
jgi:hypothetical protein